MLDTLLWVLGLVWVGSFLSYLLPQVLIKARGEQNLKEKYGATWAIVTGGSSGIGRAIVERLAAQGLNVLVAAYPDSLLDSSVKEYEAAFPSVQFRKVPVDLSSSDFIKEIEAQSKDIDVQVVINNAGYVKTGFFADGPFEAQLANHNVNATAAMTLTNYFLKKMQAKGLKGCFTFTSSPAGFMPCPSSVLYGATKAYLTLFAQSLAPEIRSDGIDVCVVHPSPVATRFYEKAHKLDSIMFFKSTAVGPEAIASILLASIGRTVTVDQGYYPICVKFLLKIVDVNLIADIITSVAQFIPDFKILRNEEKQKPKAA